MTDGCGGGAEETRADEADCDGPAECPECATMRAQLKDARTQLLAIGAIVAGGAGRLAAIGTVFVGGTMVL
jgi:hypothetical protein